MPKQKSANFSYRFHFFSSQINYFIESGHVDIEKPTEKSEPFHIHVFGNAAFLQTIFLPIHFRYHGPSNKRYLNKFCPVCSWELIKFICIFSFVAVNITLPQVFLEWDDNEDDTNGTIPVSYTCKDLRHKCKWIQVEYDVRNISNNECFIII